MRVDRSKSFDPSDVSQVESALKDLLSSEADSPEGIVELIEKFTELHDIVEEETGWRRDI